MKTCIATTLTLSLLITCASLAMNAEVTKVEKNETQKVDLLCAFAQLGNLQKISVEDVHITDMPDYLQGTDGAVLLQESLLTLLQAVTATQDGAQEFKVTIDTQKFKPFLVAVKQLNKEKEIWHLAVTRAYAMKTLLDLTTNIKTPVYKIREQTKSIDALTQKLTSIDPEWKTIADKLDQKRTGWQEKIAHCASTQPTMQELEAREKNDTGYLGSFF